jgi:hypothetical protein
MTSNQTIKYYIGNGIMGLIAFNNVVDNNMATYGQFK